MTWSVSKSISASPTARGSADRNGVDGDVVLSRDLRRLFGRHAASGIVPVGKKDEDTVFRFAALEHFDCETDGVAQHRLRTRHARLDLVEEDAHELVILGERRLEKGLGPEDDYADPIPFAALDEIVEDLFHHVEAIDAISLSIEHVARVHGTGEVHREHEVARGFHFLDRWLDELRSCQGNDGENPNNWSDQLLKDIAT